jgi:hypothetical protein
MQVKRQLEHLKNEVFHWKFYTTIRAFLQGRAMKIPENSNDFCSSTSSSFVFPFIVSSIHSVVFAVLFVQDIGFSRPTLTLATFIDLIAGEFCCVIL